MYLHKKKELKFDLHSKNTYPHRSPDLTSKFEMEKLQFKVGRQSLLNHYLYTKIDAKKLYTVRFQGLSGSAQRRSKRTPVGIYLQEVPVNSIKQNFYINDHYKEQLQTQTRRQQ